MTSAAEQYAAAMAQLIAARTGQMLDTCTAIRPAEVPQTPELDENGDVIVPPPVTVYDGPCSFSKPSDADVQDQTSNDDSGVPLTNVVRVPHGAGLRPGDEVTATACAFSPGMAGDRFVVLRPSKKTYATSERYFLRGSSWLSPEAGP